MSHPRDTGWGVLELVVLTWFFYAWLGRLALRVLRELRPVDPEPERFLYVPVTDPDEQRALRQAWEELDEIDVTTRSTNG